MDAAVHRRLLVPTLGALVALAWLSLWLWGRSPYAGYLNHAGLATIGRDGATALAVQVALYVGGWTLMTAAMMLPTSLPLLGAFQRLTAARPDRGALLGLVVAGYMAAWLAFGVAAHLFDYALHRVFDRSAWLQDHRWVFTAAPLLLAGAYQFSPLKQRCLDKCRAPVGFVIQHWRGGDARRQAFVLGAHHGAFCVGCCWALMLLMFAVGTGSLGWMLLLGAAMAVEKNTRWGPRLGAPLGAVLVAWGVLVVVDQAAGWP